MKEEKSPLSPLKVTFLQMFFVLSRGGGSRYSKLLEGEGRFLVYLDPD